MIREEEKNERERDLRNCGRGKRRMISGEQKYDKRGEK
jgi:hypothetical protein